jgi:adenosylcobinamide-phosphate synthase
MKSIFIAIILDLILGDPQSFPHPVKLMGKLIYLEDKYVRKFFSSSRGLKLAGLIMSTVNIGSAFILPHVLLKKLMGYEIIYYIVNVYLIYTCIAARSLNKEAMKVYYAFDKGIEEARYKLSFIVGRDTQNLAEGEVIRADVETVAENTSDGVIAPLFYIMLLGAPGGIMYKMVNTMDSMLGYKNEKYKDLGYFPAKIDDAFNFIPARLTGVLMCLSSILRFDVRSGIKIMMRDGKRHTSPNAGIPEAAVAGLLNIQLGGNNYYFGKLVEKPTIGDKIRNIERDDIRKAIEIMYRTELLMLLLYGFILLIC